MPGVALLDRLAVDELDAADVEAARRLVEDEQPQVAVELAGDDDLLLVAAGQRAGESPSGDGVRMSYSLTATLPRSSIASVVADGPRAYGLR